MAKLNFKREQWLAIRRRPPIVVREMHMIAGAPKRLRAQEPMPMRARGMVMAEMSADEGLNRNMEQSEAAMFHRFTYAEPVSLAPGDKLSLPLQIHQNLPAVMSYQSDHRLNVYGRDATRQIEQPLTKRIDRRLNGCQGIEEQTGYRAPRGRGVRLRDR